MEQKVDQSPVPSADFNFFFIFFLEFYVSYPIRLHDFVFNHNDTLLVEERILQAMWTLIQQTNALFIAI